jgi:putative flippase GtrA
MVPVPVVLSLPILETPFVGLVFLLSGIGTFLLAYRWGRHRDPVLLALWVAVGVGLAVVSIVTGRWNGLTDEPYGTPAFATLLPNLYGQPLHLVYYQYGTGPLQFTSYYTYLPLLVFLWIPGVDYRWITLAAWVLTLYWVRRSGPSVLLLGAPWVALLCASGFNDFLPLAALTAAFVGLSGWSSRCAEILSLAMKQFANVIVVAYHLWRREWRRAGLALAVTAAVLLPFVYWSPSGVYCHAILLTTVSGCGGAGSFSSADVFLGHINYFLWPAWILAVPGVAYAAGLYTEKGRAVRTDAEALADDLFPRRATNAGPSLYVVALAPYVQLRAWVLRLHPELWTVGKYLAVGGSGIVVNLLAFSAVRGALGPSATIDLVASTIAFGVATAWNFVWNYLWTFHGQHSRSVVEHGLGFAGASLAALAVNLGVLYALDPHVDALLAQFVGILSGTAVSFSLNRWVNFVRPARVPDA